MFDKTTDEAVHEIDDHLAFAAVKQRRDFVERIACPTCGIDEDKRHCLPDEVENIADGILERPVERPDLEMLCGRVMRRNGRLELCEGGPVCLGEITADRPPLPRILLDTSLGVFEDVDCDHERGVGKIGRL